MVDIWYAIPDFFLTVESSTRHHSLFTFLILQFLYLLQVQVLFRFYVNKDYTSGNFFFNNPFNVIGYLMSFFNGALGININR